MRVDRLRVFMLTAVLLAVGACSETPVHNENAADTGALGIDIRAVMEPVTETEFTYYSETTQMELYGEYEGYDNPDAARSRWFSDTYTASGGGVTIDLTFGSGDSPFGTDYPPLLDVQYSGMNMTEGWMEVRDRSGAVHTASSVRPSLYADGQGLGDPVLPDPNSEHNQSVRSANTGGLTANVVVAGGAAPAESRVGGSVPDPGITAGECHRGYVEHPLDGSQQRGAGHAAVSASVWILRPH